LTKFGYLKITTDAKGSMNSRQEKYNTTKGHTAEKQ
jgi:hypothetical protein